MTAFDYRQHLSKIPHEPGVYRYYDDEGTVIYVGKAKDLRNRVGSYFQDARHHDRKTRRLVASIRNIQFTIVPSEFDALLLENSLIKQHQPRFNILLRDDKMYPFICITHDRFPKVTVLRRVDRKLGTFFGPFANVKAMYNLLDMCGQLFTVRTCNLNLSEKNIAEKKFKVCLEFHLGRCKGPCEGLQSEEEYNRDIAQIKAILKGNLNVPKQFFEEKMRNAAERLAFEEAQEYKEKLQTLENFRSRSTVVNPNLGSLDVCSIVSDETTAYLNFLKITNGFISQTHSFEVKKKLDETDADILTMWALELRMQFQSEATELLVNTPLTIDFKGVTVTVPQIGDKRKLVEMSLKNVIYFRKEKADRVVAEETAGNPKMRVMMTLKNDLQLKELPRIIECFDNSNIQGTNPVSAMVCFKDGQPSKKDYRQFIPKTVEGPNDFATMKEVVFRRYSRLLQEEAELPQLIIVDGGKGQLSAACEALKELGLYGKIPIVGIAKRLEEIYFPEDSLPLYIDKRSESLKLIQRLRDEAHRFGITHHRDRRSKGFLVSELEGIEGIGKVTAAKLLTHFKTIKNVREAPTEALEAVLGRDRTRKLRDYFEKAKG